MTTATLNRTVQCLHCRKEFEHDPTNPQYCAACIQIWETEHLPGLISQAQEQAREAAVLATRQRQDWLAELETKGRLCRYCKNAERKGDHPGCEQCFEAYLDTLDDCANDCGGKVKPGYRICLQCKHEAEDARVNAAEHNRRAEAQKLSREAYGYYEMGLKGTNGIRASYEYILAHIEYFREEAQRVQNTPPRHHGSQRRPRHTRL